MVMAPPTPSAAVVSITGLATPSCQTGLDVGNGVCSGRDFNGRGILWFQRPIAPGGLGIQAVLMAIIGYITPYVYLCIRKAL